MRKLIFRTFNVMLIVFGLLGIPHTQTISEPVKSLNARQQSIIPIAALTAKGALPELKLAINHGLDTGLTINEIKEVIIHLYAYSGFPRSIRGLQTLMEVLDDRKAIGITDKTGKETTPVISELSKYDRGKMNLEILTGKPSPDTLIGYAAFAPAMDIFLKEHLFADIFDRDVLTFVEREIVTISVLSAIGGAEPMLRSHLAICLNLDITPLQLSEFVRTIASIVGEKNAKEVQVILNEVLANR